MLEHFGTPPKIAPRRKVYPSDLTIFGFTPTKKRLSLMMDSVKTITELRHKISASIIPVFEARKFTRTRVEPQVYEA